MSIPPPVKRLALPNALRQRELEAGLGGNRRGPSVLGNVQRSPEVYVPTARNLLQRYPIPEPVDPRSISPFPWKRRAAGMPWLDKMQENENYLKMARPTKRKRNNQLTNNQSVANNTVRRKINVNSNKPNKPNNANTRKSKKARRTRKN